MKICVIYGTERKGSSYQIAQALINKLDPKKITELFLPSALPKFCVSCFSCFNDDWQSCPHHQFTIPAREALIESDLIIMTSPVYSLHLTGQMKTFLDHFANMFIVHRPEPSMFRKQGVIIATSIGPVTGSTIKSIKDSLDFWGVAKTYTMGFAMQQTDWEKVNDRIKKKIEKRTNQIAKSIQKHKNRPPISFRVKKWFYLSQFMQKRFGYNLTDVSYWSDQGWLDGSVPWHDTPR